MKLILKNVDLQFSAKKKKYFTDLVKNVNEFGGGYCSSTDLSGCSKDGNIITTNLSGLGLKLALETGHTYLFGVCKSEHYKRVTTANATNVNGVAISGYAADANKQQIIIVTDDPDSTTNFKTHGYIDITSQGGPVLSSAFTVELYCYDITGEDSSKFDNITFAEIQSGKIGIYADE